MEGDAHMYDDENDGHHRACPCGCGELSDECAGPDPSPLGSMTLRIPAPA